MGPRARHWEHVFLTMDFLYTCKVHVVMGQQ